MLSEGRTANEMAGTLNLMVNTVEAHRDDMMQSFGVQTISELVRLAVSMGLVTVDAGTRSIADRLTREVRAASFLLIALIINHRSSSLLKDSADNRDSAND